MQRRPISRLALLCALAMPVLAHASCPLKPDAAAPLEAQIDAMTAKLDDCDDGHTLSFDDVQKAKIRLDKLKDEVVRTRREGGGALPEAERTRLSEQFTRILAGVSGT